MLLLFFFIATVVLGYLAYKYEWSLSASFGGYQFAFWMVLVVCCILILAVPISRYGDRIFIEQIRQTQATIDNARLHDRLTEYERAALSAKIIDMNNALIERKILQANIWVGIFQHPEIEYCQPLQ